MKGVYLKWEGRENMKKRKVLIGLISVFLLAGMIFTLYVFNNNQEKPIVAKSEFAVEDKGVMLKVKLNRNSYTLKEDEIIITGRVTNESEEPYSFITKDSCDTGFSFEMNGLMEKHYQLSSIKVNEKETLGGMCLMAMGSDLLKPGEFRQLKIVLTPLVSIGALKEKEHFVRVGFKEQVIDITLPVNE